MFFSKSEIRLIVLSTLFVFVCNQKLPIWGDWTAWTQCTKLCGEGTQTRRRICQNGVTCPGDATNAKSCNVQARYGNWSPWNPWSSCSKPCAVGLQKRKRSCLGAVRCIGGLSEESKTCNIEACPLGQWSNWAPWKDCTKTCVGGKRERQRDCKGTKVGTWCPGLSSMTEGCGVGACAGAWQAWLPWTACSTSCSGGTRRRNRYCIGGICAAGENSEEVTCNSEVCETVGKAVWELWGEWSKCSVSCGSGTQTRTRSCDGNGGPCLLGTPTDSKSCNLNPCSLFDLGNILSSPLNNSMILDMVTKLFSGYLSNPSGNIFNSLGLGSLLGGLGNGGQGLSGLNFGSLLGPVMKSIPATATRSGRSQADINRIVSQGLKNALDQLNTKNR